MEHEISVGRKEYPETGKVPKHGRDAKQELARKWVLIRRNWQLYLFILPAFAYFIVFCYAPMYGVQIAFKNYTGGAGITASPWAEPIYKYFQLFFEGAWFTTTLKNTLALSLYSFAVGSILPVLLALMINELKNIHFQKVIQNATYIPNFISTVVLVGMINILFSRTGIINQFIQLLGYKPVYFLMKDSIFRHLYVWSGVWQGTGWGSIIYFAALSNVPEELYEAAIIDGASRIQRIVHINIPTLMPTFIIMLILGAGTIMNVSYEKVLLMQTDLNLKVSEVINTYVYKVGLLHAQFSLSSAVGLFNNIINLILLLLVNKISRKVSETSLW